MSTQDSYDSFINTLRWPTLSSLCYSLTCSVIFLMQSITQPCSMGPCKVRAIQIFPSAMLQNSIITSSYQFILLGQRTGPCSFEPIIIIFHSIIQCQHWPSTWPKKILISLTMFSQRRVCITKQAQQTKDIFSPCGFTYPKKGHFSQGFPIWL